MLFFSILFILIPLIQGRRDDSVGSWLMRKALEKTMPTTEKNEHTRSTQSPTINIHLSKSEFPVDVDLKKHKHEY